MLTFVYLLAATAATANQEAAVLPAPPPAPVTYAPPLSESDRLLLRKQGFAEPLGNPGAWVRTDDYPPEALQKKRSGMTEFRVQVNTAGRVASCEVTVSSGHSDLDVATCKYVTERAIFKPALDKRSRPTSGVYENRVRWQIPVTPVPGPETFTLVYTIETDGSVGDCKLTGSTASGIDPCLYLPTFVPPVDKSGNPVKKQIIYSSVLRVGELADAE